jgi:hypothetical protein
MPKGILNKKETNYYIKCISVRLPLITRTSRFLALAGVGGYFHHRFGSSKIISSVSPKTTAASIADIDFILSLQVKILFIITFSSHRVGFFSV